LWTWVTLFAYVTVFGARLLNAQSAGALPALPGIPLNLLILMGLSATTATGSKGVAISYKSRGLIGQQSGGLVTNPEGEGDLVKTQMIVWSLIGAAVYLLSLGPFLAALSPGNQLSVALPDIDGGLLVLMGASQGAYFGNKLVTREIAKKPKLDKLLPAQGPAGAAVTLTGENFGDQQGESFVALNGRTVRSQADGLMAWSDLQIQITIPSTYKAGDTIQIEVYRDGEWSENKLLFAVT